MRSALGWIGRQRSRAVAALVVIGIALPPLGAILKPYVAEAVIGLLVIAFLRSDLGALRALIRRPALLLAAVGWTALAVPALFVAADRAFGLHALSPALFMGLMLQAVASPVMAAPAFAALMGLDATLVLTTMILSTALVPVTAPVFAALAGIELALSPAALGLRLIAILAGSAAVGLGLRWLLGPAAIARHRDEIDGINIFILFVFVAAVMGDVGVQFLSMPLTVLGVTALAFAVFALLLALTFALFAAAGAERAFALSMMSCQRNMGLMVAATGGAVPELTWLYFAVSQFPIYLSPLMLGPVARRIGRRRGPGSAPP